jgi:hypothetical protein
LSLFLWLYISFKWERDMIRYHGFANMKQTVNNCQSQITLKCTFWASYVGKDLKSPQIYETLF